MPHGEHGGRGLFEVKGNKDQLKKMLKEMKKHPSIMKIEMCFIKEEEMICSIFSKNCTACRALADSHSYLVSGNFIGDGSVEWRVITGDEGALADLVKNLEEGGCDVKLVNANKLNSRALLTSRQQTIIQEALNRGYYDYPKKITIKDLSKAFNISPSTLGEILQRGEKKVIFEHFRKWKLYDVPFYYVFHDFFHLHMVKSSFIILKYIILL